jgi:citrate lyase beta subunit
VAVTADGRMVDRAVLRAAAEVLARAGGQHTAVTDTPPRS